MIPLASVNNPRPGQSQAERLSKNPNDPRLTDLLVKVTEVARQTRSYAYAFFKADDGSMLEVRSLHDKDRWWLTVVDETGKHLDKPVGYGDGAPVVLPEEQERVQVPQAEIDEKVKPPEPEPEPKKRRWWDL